MKVGDRVKYVVDIKTIHTFYQGIGYIDRARTKPIELGWEDIVEKIYNTSNDLENGIDFVGKNLYPWVKLLNSTSYAPAQCLQVISSESEPEKIPCDCPTWNVVNFGCKNKNHY